ITSVTTNTTQQRLTTRGQIIALREEGLICHRRTTCCFDFNCEEVMSVCHSINGIPSYDTGDQKTLLCLFSERRPRPRLTTRDEDAAIREALHLDICAQTVRSHLHEAVIQNRVPAIKERLTYQHRNGRLQFAQQYVGEDLEFWSRVVFTDEKTFASTNHGKIHLWRPNRMRYNRAHIYEVARSGHVTLNMWGYISQH
ncbi:putative Transposable element Tc1 transposase-like 49, partial [Homarus americanus]